jgi:hypothetical protein
VPLSEHEQRLLEQMERALEAEDPKFASALQGAELRVRFRRRMVAGLVGFVVAAGGAGVGAYFKSLPSALAGAALALVCLWYAALCWRRMPAPGEMAPRRHHWFRRKAKRQPSTFIQRFELRWQHRRERDGF